MIRRSQAVELAGLGVFAILMIAGAFVWGWLKSAPAALSIASFSHCAAVSLALQRAKVGDPPQQAARRDRRAANILAAGLAIDFSAMLLVIRFPTTRSMDSIEIVLAAASILASWVLLNLLFAIHCAHPCFPAHPAASRSSLFLARRKGRFPTSLISPSRSA